jgi:GntR family transcriptional regulator, transcriptional repressor for pyruvate dehydrogenase complex
MTIHNALPVTTLNPRHRRSHAIADEIRVLILRGQLKAGDKLPTETNLCSQFGVSRTTLREAVQMLRSTGLLEVTPGRGSYVRSPSLSALMPSLILAARSQSYTQAEVISLRHVLQREALQNIQRQHARLKEPLRQLFAHTLNLNARAEENAETEAKWHLALQALSGNAMSGVMVQILLGLGAESRTQSYQTAESTTLRMHALLRINTALIEGDFAAAERTLAQLHTTSFSATRAA